MISNPDNIIDELFKGKIPVDKPVCYILYGAPCSGKSYMIPQIKQSSIILNIDKLVSLIPEYKQFLIDCKLDFTKYKSIDDISADVYKKCDDKYYKCRKEANEILNKALIKAIAGKYNIIYETTGNTDRFLIKHFPLLARYTFNLYCLIADPKVIKERIWKRAKITGRITNPLIVEEKSKNSQNNLQLFYNTIKPNKFYLLSNNDIIVSILKSPNNVITKCKYIDTFLKNKEQKFIDFINGVCNTNTNTNINSIIFGGDVSPPLILIIVTCILAFIIIIVKKLYKCKLLMLLVILSIISGCCIITHNILNPCDL